MLVDWDTVEKNDKFFIQTINGSVIAFFIYMRSGDVTSKRIYFSIYDPRKVKPTTDTVISFYKHEYTKSWSACQL